MKAGELRHQVTLQQKTLGQGDFGAPTETWTDVATVYAAVEPLNGREYFAADQSRADVTTRIRLRFRPGVVPAMRVLYDGRTFEIQGPPIDVDERHRELHLMAREVI